ncbi:MAG: hypothetical protein ACJ8G3_22785 [Burkholderiaceae bacterium]
MQLQISGISQTQCQQFLDQAKKLLDTTRGALRLSEVVNRKTEQKVLYLRERTWGEFFLEKLILTPQEMVDMQNETLAAIELAFFPLAQEPKGQAENASSKSEDSCVPCLDELADGILSKNFIDGNDEAMGIDMHVGECKSRLRSRILDKDTSVIEIQSAKPDWVRTFNGLLTVPKGISVSTCPALQVIAHNVVVSSVGAVSVQKVPPYSALQRALQAFNVAWTDLPIKTLPKRGEVSVLVYKENLVCKAGLRHIQKLLCIPDDRKRDQKNVLAGNEQSCWESLYENCYSNAEGSIVLELYPDYYENDPQVLGGRRAFYSEANIKGAIAAAVNVREEMRRDEKEPLSIMFAGMDQGTYTRISDELKKAGDERERANSKPPLNRDMDLLNSLLTPGKFPSAAVNNPILQNVVRMVPKIRTKLKLEKKQRSLAYNSSSDSDSEANN